MRLQSSDSLQADIKHELISAEELGSARRSRQMWQL